MEPRQESCGREEGWRKGRTRGIRRHNREIMSDEECNGRSYRCKLQWAYPMFRQYKSVVQHSRALRYLMLRSSRLLDYNITRRRRARGIAYLKRRHRASDRV